MLDEVNRLKLPTCLVGSENDLLKKQSLLIIDLERKLIDQQDRICELEQKLGG